MFQINKQTLLALNTCYDFFADRIFRSGSVFYLSFSLYQWIFFGLVLSSLLRIHFHLIVEDFDLSSVLVRWLRFFLLLSFSFFSSFDGQWRKTMFPFIICLIPPHWPMNELYTLVLHFNPTQFEIVHSHSFWFWFTREALFFQHSSIRPLHLIWVTPHWTERYVLCTSTSFVFVSVCKSTAIHIANYQCTFDRPK